MIAIKIVTVNIPESFIEAIEKLVGEEGLYPSRSELIRCAVREFLIKELKLAQNIVKYKEEDNTQDLDEDSFVRVPIERLNENHEPVRDFKTYKILKTLNDSEGYIPKNDFKTSKSDPEEEKSEVNSVDIKVKRKKKEGLGNPFWENKLDHDGNLISVPKRITGDYTIGNL